MGNFEILKFGFILNQAKKLKSHNFSQNDVLHKLKESLLQITVNVCLNSRRIEEKISINLKNLMSISFQKKNAIHELGMFLQSA